MSTAEVASTVETRAMPNTVVFGFVKALASELSQGQVELPSVPDIVLKLQKTLSDENVSNDIVVRVVGSEPMLAGKLMNMANSAALNSSFGSFVHDSLTVLKVGDVYHGIGKAADRVKRIRHTDSYGLMEWQALVRTVERKGADYRQ